MTGRARLQLPKMAISPSAAGAQRYVGGETTPNRGTATPPLRTSAGKAGAAASDGGSPMALDLPASGPSGSRPSSGRHTPRSGRLSPKSGGRTPKSGRLSPAPAGAGGASGEKARAGGAAKGEAGRRGGGRGGAAGGAARRAREPREPREPAAGSGAGGGSAGAPRRRAEHAARGPAPAHARTGAEVAAEVDRLALSSRPPVVRLEDAPGLVAKLRSQASPDVLSGARGLWALVQAGEKACVAGQDGVLDALAHVLHSAAALPRFFALATLGQLAFFSAPLARRVAAHARVRSGVVAVLRGGKGIEGEAAKVVGNTAANCAESAAAWVAEEGLLAALQHCSAASQHISTCVAGALFALSRAPGGAAAVAAAGLGDSVLAAGGPPPPPPPSPLVLIGHAASLTPY